VCFAGRDLPIEISGKARMRRYRLTGKVNAFPETGLDDKWGDWESWDELGDVTGPCWYRDILRKKLYVSVGDIEIGHSATKMAPISTTLTEVQRHG
jgi:hypothetical protein